jgi:DNA-binding LytR/AlgR family response regulator
MNCLIIDDEPIARKGLREYILETEFLNCIGECEDALRASKYLNEQPIDLIYLDIQMPKISGVEFLKTLRHPPLVIITTAYSEYALEGYSLDVVDYLMKPITFERFLKATQKARDIYQMRRFAEEKRTVQPDHFFIKSDSKYEKVGFSDVRYVESLQNYVVIHTSAKKLIAYMTLAGLEQQLPADQFMKVHKSFIVSIASVKSVDGNELVIDNARIPISRALKEAVVDRILGKNLFKR